MDRDGRCRLNQVVGSNAEAILSAVRSAAQIIPPEHPMFYGDGQASARIVQLMETSAQ